MSDAPNFMQSPLAVWIQTFSLEPVLFKDLVDGVYLNEVLLQIDPKSSLDGIKNNVEDSRDKMTNWELFMKNIRLFYQDVLDYYIVMKPPNIYTICSYPESELARLEVLKSLHLLLGCAIHCEMKEVFVEGIMSLPEEVQVSMMGYIQELQSINSNVIGSHLLSDEIENTNSTVFSHIMQLIQQRDEYLQEIKSLRLTIDETEFDQSFLHSIAINDNCIPEVIGRFSPNITTAKSHKNRLVVELAECKAKLRKLRHDLEDRDDAVSELEMEVDCMKQSERKLKRENLELTRDVRAIKSVQDELDIVRDRANRCERLEAEIHRYKEKMVDLDFYKSRVEELRLDNSALFENRSVMEDQLKAAHKRIEAVVGLENELQKYKEQRDALILDCNKHRIQSQSVVEEYARLEHEKQASTNARIEEELRVALDSMHNDSSHSLYDQLSQTVNSQVLKLELENQRLKQDLEQSRETTMLENTSKMLTLEKENSRLAAKVDRFLEASGIEEQLCLDLRHSNEELTREKKHLEETIECLKETSERQLKEFEKENDQLSQMIEGLRERGEKTNDLRVKDLESENKKLNEKLLEFAVQVARLEQERKTLNRRSVHLMDEAGRCRALEMENRKHELENEELNRTLQVSSTAQLGLEDELSALEIENRKLVRTVETLEKAGSKRETLEMENSRLTSEVHSLKISTTVSLSRIDALEKASISLNLQLEQSVEQYKAKELQVEKLERENFDLNTDKQHDQNSLASLKERIKEIEQEFEIQENHSAQLSRKIEDLNRSHRHLEDVEKRLKDLESELERSKKDKSVLSKENKRLKQNLLVKESTIDDLTSKLTELGLEFKTLTPLIERSKDLEFNLSELEKENLGIIQSATVDKKTIGSLREDLVNEKIHCQQLQTEIENLKHQLTSLAITTEKSIASGIERDEGSLKILESRMEEVYEKRINSQAEQIQLLEKRVKDQVKMMQSGMELSGDDGPTKERTLVVTQRYSNSPSATQDIINLKEHIIELERMNDTVEEEKRDIKRQNLELHENVKQIQSQNSQWQTQLLSFQTQQNNLQSQLATTEVENRTLQSENTSLGKQNSVLQDQCSRTEALAFRFQRQHEDFVTNHDALEKDLGQLQTVHDRLIAEHEALIVKHASLKDVYRGSRSDVKYLRQRCSELTREKEMITQLKTVLERDKEDLKSESHHLESLQTDYIHMQEDNLRLLNANDKVNGELQDCNKELRLAKAETQQLKAKIDELTVDNVDLNKKIGDRNAENSKQVFHLEETLQWVTKLEEENQSLIIQMKLLISQNQELLTKLLESKDQHIFVQKTYLQRLTELRQQKEKLEERFMEQHRRFDPVKNKQRSITANFVKKAKQMIKGKSRENVNVDSALDGSSLSVALENSSCDSESIGCKRSAGVRNSSASNPGISSREISANAASKREDIAITLDEFLHECNQSPKSRRKLLVEKQVSLDENIDSASDITQKPLQPRRPTIHGESSDRVSVIETSTSEMNISSRAVTDKRHSTVSDWTSFESSSLMSAPGQIIRPRVRPVVASRPVVVPRGSGIDQVQWCRESAQTPESAPVFQSSMPHFDQSTGSPFAEQSGASVPASRRTRQMRSQSCCEGQSGVNSGCREVVQSGLVYGEKEDELCVVKCEATKTPLSSSSRRTSHGDDVYLMQSRGKPHDRPYPNVDLGLVKHQPESTYLEAQQQVRGNTVQDHHFVKQNSALDPSADDDDDDPGLGSQYNPGNVRNLVNSFQHAVKPGTTNSPLHSTPKDRTVRPHSAAPDAPNSSANGRNSNAPTSRVVENSLLKPDDRNEINVVANSSRPEPNVCVVRPASGKILPSNPCEQLNPDN